LPIAFVLGTVAGCAPKTREPLEVCPGKSSAAEALVALRSNSKNMVALKARGQCHLKYYLEGKKKPQSESFDVQLWVNPPEELYLQGNKPFISKAIVLGSNDRQFWLAIKPKEISLYCWGNWSEQDSSEGPAINPGTLLEALGIAELEAGREWSLSNEGAFDVLTKRERGAITRKMCIYCCDYRIRKIEFFDSNGRAVARAELDGYQEVSEGFFVPAMMKVTTQGRDRAEDSLSITLDLANIKPAEITEPQRKYLFNLPPQKGFKNVRRIVNGKWVEDSQ
ncbi:MAG: hypothetical protein ACYTEK_20705, partial [Planctomycetota bacterium]